MNHFSQLEYIKGTNEDDFINNEMIRDACLMRLEVLSDYHWHLSLDIEYEVPYNEDDWQVLRMCDPKNNRSRDYHHISWRKVWKGIEVINIRLKEKIEDILQKEKTKLPS